MHFPTILSTLAAGTLALAAPAPEAAANGNVNADTMLQERADGCFKSGETWGGDRSNARSKVNYFCDKYADRFYKGDERHECFNLSSLKKVDLTLAYIGSEGSRVIEVAECKDGLLKEVNGCDRGGAHGYANWRYT